MSEQKQKKRKARKILKTGVIYIKHIPHGFYEDEMKGFFSQFGKVLKVCVARSAKTGNSKGFGYVQFGDPEVAKIAAETMNNYLMFEKLIKCKVLPPELVTSSTFANASRRPGHNCPAQRRTDRAIQLLAARKGKSQKRNALRRREAAQKRTISRLAQLGIKYDLDGGLVQEIEPVPAAADETSPPAAADSPLPVMEVDESDDEVTFKTPPNVVKRRLSQPAASTPAGRATPRAGPSAGTPKPGRATPAKTPKLAGKSPGKPAKKGKTTPAKAIPAKVTPAKATSAKASPAKVTPAKVTPAKVTPAKVTPAKVTPAKVTSAKVTPAKITPSKVSPAKSAKKRSAMKKTPLKKARKT